jgi:hypothetical protein
MIYCSFHFFIQRRPERKGERARTTLRSVARSLRTVMSSFFFPSVYALKVDGALAPALDWSDETDPRKSFEVQVRSDASLKATLRIDLPTDPWELYLSGPAMSKEAFPFAVGASHPGTPRLLCALLFSSFPLLLARSQSSPALASTSCVPLLSSPSRLPSRRSD